MEVLNLISAGLSNNKISEQLFISLSTVKTHIRKIYLKLNVNNRKDAVIKAKEMNIFEFHRIFISFMKLITLTNSIYLF